MPIENLGAQGSRRADGDDEGEGEMPVESQGWIRGVLMRSDPRSLDRFVKLAIHVNSRCFERRN